MQSGYSNILEVFSGCGGRGVQLEYIVRQKQNIFFTSQSSVLQENCKFDQLFYQCNFQILKFCIFLLILIQYIYIFYVLILIEWSYINTIFGILHIVCNVTVQVTLWMFCRQIWKYWKLLECFYFYLHVSRSKTSVGKRLHLMLVLGVPRPNAW